MTSQLRSLFVVITFTSLLTSSLRAESWPGFRGAAGTGVSTETKLPSEWSQSKNLAWKAKLDGRANSSPCVTADHVFVTTQLDDKSLWVVCVARENGKVRWNVKVGAGELAAKGPKNLYAHRHNPATPTCAADDKNVWTFFGTGLLLCLNAKSGDVVWSRDMVEDFGAYDITFGMGSSPRLWGDVLYVSCMTKGASYVVALNKSDGKEVWKKERRLPAEFDGPDAYSTPVVFKEQLLVSGSDHIDAYDLKSGKQLWLSSGLDIKSEFGRIIASPAVSDEVVIATSGNPGGGGLGRSIALKPGGKGDVTESHRLWVSQKTTPDSSSPLVYEGRVYMVSHEGIASCLEPTTGEIAWRKRLSKGPYYAALVAGDGKVYFQSMEGVCTVVEAGDEGKVIAENSLSGEFYATPAISDGTIFLRSYEGLYAISD